MSTRTKPPKPRAKLVVTLPVEWRGGTLELALPNRRVGIGGIVTDEIEGFFPWIAAPLSTATPKKCRTEILARRAVERALGVRKVKEVRHGK